MCGFFSIHKKDDNLTNLESSIRIVKKNLEKRGPDSQVSLFLDSSLIQSSNLKNIKNFNFDIILVDNGSTDNSLEIIKKFSKKVYKK